MNFILPTSQRMPARRFVIYLPDNNRYGEQISNIDSWVEEACLLLTQINGGATCLPPARGMWFNENDNCLIHETTHVVYSHIRVPAFFQHAGQIRTFITRFGRETQQDSVAVEFDGTIYFLSPDTVAEADRLSHVSLA